MGDTPIFPGRKYPEPLYQLSLPDLIRQIQRSRPVMLKEMKHLVI